MPVPGRQRCHDIFGVSGQISHHRFDKLPSTTCLYERHAALPMPSVHRQDHDMLKRHHRRAMTARKRKARAKVAERAEKARAATVATLAQLEGARSLCSYRHCERNCRRAESCRTMSSNCKVKLARPWTLRLQSERGLCTKRPE